MRIATLQFSPRLGKVEANIQRADELLAKAANRLSNARRPLDVLVLPEMVFSGYNFSSLKTIGPYLEPTEAGRTAEWVRATARRLGCVVCAGYPEIKRKDTIHNPLATRSEGVNEDAVTQSKKSRFNSLLIVDSRGETILNYQKRFLYYTDETWAEEGENGKGFFQLPLSKSDVSSPHASISSEESEETNNALSVPTVAGICMDINPYKFLAPQTAYEFATHVLESGAKLVILSMAWTTYLKHEDLSSLPQQPDMETFQYWVRRFWPFVSGEKWDGGEIVIVCANRYGEEEGLEGKETTRYAGTSCVMAIRRPKRSRKLNSRRSADGANDDKQGGLAAEDAESEAPPDLSEAEIVVWDMLGRAEEGICYADTDSEPRMVFRVKRVSESD
ncbi:hypothetical protein VTO42DRAFT_3237 [Malbranchea cinnamomea]